MKNDIRSSGIGIVGNIPWGTHFCQFYKTKEDLMEIVIPYFKTGLENKEFCLWITSDIIETADAKKVLKEFISDIDTYFEKGQIEIIPFTDFYSKEGILDSQKVLNDIINRANQALISGYNGLRLTENVCSFKKEKLDNFIDYEEMLNSVIDKYPVIALCTYSLEMCSSIDTVEIAANHDFVLAKKKNKWEQIRNHGRESIEGRKRTKDELQEANRELSEGKERLQFILDNSPDNIFLQDLELRYVWVSRPEGLSIDQYLGHTDIELGNISGIPDSGRELHAIKQQILESGIGRTLEVTLDAPSGPQYFISIYEPWRNKKGQVIGLAGYVRNVTEIKKAQKAAEKERARLQTIIENIPVAVGETDTSGGVLLDNGILESIWRGKHKLGSVSDYQEFKAWWPETGEKVKPEEWPAAQALKGEASTATFDIKKFDGTKGTIIVSAKPIMNENREVVSVIWINQDITELKQTEERLNQAYEQLQIQSEELQASYEELQVHSEELQVQTEELEEAYASLDESEKRYCLLFTNMTEGFLLGEIICDDAGKPYDYRYLEINPAFELHTGIKRELILGKTALEAFHSIPSIELEEFGKIAISGGSTHFEVYAPPADRYYSIYSFSPEKGKFAVIFTDITERKAAEEALRESEASRKVVEAVETERQRLISVLDTLPVYVILLSPDYHVSFANRFFEERFGKSEGRRCYEYLFQRTEPCENCETYKALKTGSPHHWEWIGPDGHNYDIYDYPFKDSDGSLLIMEVGIDITKRKRAQEELKKTTEILNAISQNLPDLIYAKDCQCRLVYASESVLRLLGKSENELLGKTDAEFHPDPELGKAVMENDRLVRETCKSLITEEPTRLPDGSLKIFLSTKVPWIATDGTLLGTLGISMDVTERKQAEEALRESQFRLETVFSAIEDAIIEYDINGKPVRANKAAIKAYGLSLPELTRDKAIEKLKITHMDNSPVKVEELPISRALKGKPITGELYRFTNVEGKELIISTYAAPLFKDNKISGAVNLWHDITELKQAQDTLIKFEIARQKEIHHRIKNNLQVISSLLDLQAEKFNNKENVDCSEVLKAFRESQDRVMSIALIHRELHEGEGTDKLNFSLYLKRLADNLFQTYRLENSNVSFNLDLEENIFFDMDIAVPFGLIVNEIISNSLKYAFSGGNEGKIQVKLRRKEDTKAGNKGYVLNISDNGIGIPENVNFENPDTLGLQLVNILVDQIDGCIKLKRNQGTEFIIRFTVEER